MELLYTRISKINSQPINLEFCFTNKYDIKHQADSQKYIAKKLESRIPQNFFGKNINQINLVVGQNGVGKTTLMKMLGSKKNDIVANQNEWTSIYQLTEEKFIIQSVAIPDVEEMYAVRWDDKTQEFIKGEKLNISPERLQYKILYSMSNKRELPKWESSDRGLIDHHYINNATDENEYNFLKEYANKFVNYQDKFVYKLRINYYDLQEEDNKTIPKIKMYLDKEKEFENHQGVQSALSKFSNKQKFILRFMKMNIIYLLRMINEQATNPEIAIEIPKVPDIDIISFLAEKTSDLKFDKIINYQKNILNDIFPGIKNLLKISYEYIEQTESMLVELQKLDDKYYTTNDIEVNLLDDVEKTSLDTIVEIISDSNNQNEPLTFKTFVSVDLPALSDGQRELIKMLASVKSSIDTVTQDSAKEILILLDEPGVYLHPEWSRNLINYLINLLNDGNPKIKFNVIITTHSPFIVSDIPRELVLQIKDNEVQKAKNSYAANLYDLLSDAFFLDAPIGKFAEKKINRILTSINELGHNISRARLNEIDEEISLIGDSLVREKLQEIKNQKTGLTNRVNVLNAELKKLKAMDEY